MKYSQLIFGNHKKMKKYQAFKFNVSFLIE